MRQTKIGKQTKPISGRILWAVGSLPKTVHWEVWSWSIYCSRPPPAGVVLGTIKDLGKGGQTRSNSCSPCRLGPSTNSALAAS